MCCVFDVGLWCIVKIIDCECLMFVLVDLIEVNVCELVEIELFDNGKLVMVV